LVLVVLGRSILEMLAFLVPPIRAVVAVAGGVLAVVPAAPVL
jgi:hypothetical protein